MRDFVSYRAAGSNLVMLAAAAENQERLNVSEQNIAERNQVNALVQSWNQIHDNEKKRIF
ncbi:MAG: hypothetical protein CMI56_00065 [Parcubacteria group bacterium]|nr:hypothetical protein [Parcubacteria group bacterium]